MHNLSLTTTDVAIMQQFFGLLEQLQEGGKFAGMPPDTAIDMVLTHARSQDVKAFVSKLNQAAQDFTIGDRLIPDWFKLIAAQADSLHLIDPEPSGAMCFYLDFPAFAGRFLAGYCYEKWEFTVYFYPSTGMFYLNLWDSQEGLSLIETLVDEGFVNKDAFNEKPLADYGSFIDQVRFLIQQIPRYEEILKSQEEE